ncbi:DNA (cytosine-5-)-methyltransferase [Clostridium botulinum C]|uniref:Cytosine-specific methyltransferase n=2 Tax=Clostridium botulinum TaxID=1491 RepID=A0A9Q4XW92_CLOBO|nr:DNA (cytosine-5-)-methyltransferase [Clostridium botulinum]MCD3196005.1 DNA (cytosine-5-)-methyltransferase [Clostridium botulinum C]MCD3201381.1 DNA (cytosine-5-)-methyltransferase [Clostridium botulinum C]MCD3206829.1 DNA (cytosine-5-)-methyltransferase [Clostridium botulinum C]MCD3209056.1 DNA (cytosine-5-)-methyltransferase [Clostridium botulinum C]MCD3216320.1 DNA (cytosine-5-)-methyltransferase [Clostridium botulinum C]
MEKTVIELFAGVGGFHLGLSRAGNWNVVWANQWEPSRTRQDAYNCYISHFPNTVASNIDIAEVNNNPNIYKIPQHSLLVGGFPCQDYSVASTGARGIQGKKGVLWWEIKKILEREQSPFVLLENVDRLLKSPAKQRGRDFGIMLACFRDLGYNVEWRVINAADYGFAQRRRRVFIFAYKNSTNYFNRVEREIAENGVENYFYNNSFFSSEFQISGISNRNTCILEDNILNISDEFSFGFFEAGILNGNEISTYKVIPRTVEAITLREILQRDVPERFYLGEDLSKWHYMKGAKAEPRRSSTGHEYMYREGALSFPDNIDIPARTMLTSEASKNRSTHVVEDPQTGRLRLLTPIECERLNCFEDDWTNTGMSERFRYFCMGNALVVGLIEKMGRKLSDIFDEES